MSRDHEVVFETDGRHSSVYLYEPPMSERQYVEPIDEMLDLGIDTISYVVGDCSVLLYDTKVGELWGHNIDLIDHTVWYRAAQNVRSMIDRGIDPLRLVCEHAQERGFQFLPHLLLNMHHTAHDRVTNGRVADYTTEHPQWQVGPEPQFPDAEHDHASRLSFAMPEVRANRLAVIRELVCDYPTDGIEINFFVYAPYIARCEVAKHTETLTDWVRQIRAVCEEAAADKGRRKRLVVRVGATIAGNQAMGMDVATWIRDELVDTVIAMPVGSGFECNTSHLQELVETTRNTRVNVLAGQDSVGTPQTREVHHAAAANAYAAGAKGIIYHRYYPHPNRYPYDDSDFGRIRFMGYPDLLRHKDKCFRMGQNMDRDTSRNFGLAEPVPTELAPGDPGPTFTIEVSDDLSAKAKLGELWSCELKIMLDSLMHDDVLRLRWNDCEIPLADQRWADWIFQMRPRANHVRGYRLHVQLKDDWLPKVGANTVQVELLKKDEKLVNPVTVSEIEIVVKYLPGRHGLRPEEQYAGGVVFTP